MSKREALTILFAPFLINLVASMAVYFTTPHQLDPSQMVKILYSKIFSYQSALMVIIQLGFGIYLLRYCKGLYDFRLKDLLLSAGLVAFSLVTFTVEHVTSSLIYGMSYEEYSKWFRDVVSMTPAWARYMNALIVPFTAGIFEEVIWRGYGITKLEEFASTRVAVLVQALAFALWHISPIHVLFVFPIGLAYGYAFVKRRSLAPLTLAHVVTDLLGMSVWLT